MSKIPSFVTSAIAGGAITPFSTPSIGSISITELEISPDSISSMDVDQSPPSKVSPPVPNRISVSISA